MLDYLLTDGGLFVVGLWTLVFLFVAAIVVRGEWRRAHRISARRVEEVREYTREWPLYYDAADWEREPHA